MRVEDWAVRLQTVIDDARHKPYRIGVHDCFIFACKCAEAMTGVDYFEKNGALYASRREALRAIRVRGGAAKAVDALLGADRRRSVLQARRGDWVLFKDQLGEHLGVCIGPRVFVLTPEGLGTVPVRDCITAWEIS